jgi:CheY-like chemotaxis protein
MAQRLLIVDDETTLCDSLKRVFERDGYEVATAGEAEAGLHLFEEGTFDLVLSDILLPGMSGIEFLEAIKKQAPEQIVIVMTAYASIETAVGALRAGAHDYILKPVIHEEIKRLVRLALNARSLKTENLLLKKQIDEHFDFENILGKSPTIQALIEMVKKIADSRTSWYWEKPEPARNSSPGPFTTTAPAGTNRLFPSIAVRSPTPSWNPNYSGMSGVPSPVPIKPKEACSKKPTAARFF